MAPSTARTPSLSRGSLCRQSSTIRTGCANERPSGSAGGVPREWYPYRDLGGKGERTLLQFKFVPVLTLKGVFSRESLSLTSDDIGIQGFSDAAPLEPGQLRLLILGRSSQGYAILRQSSSLEQAVPLLRDSNDGLLETVKVLLAVNASRERPGKVVLLLEGLRKQRGPSVIPLLAALERRSLLAAQRSDVMEAIAPHLSDPSPAVREQAARTLHSLLQNDYLEQTKLREGAVKALAASLEMADSSFAPRVAAFETLGAAGARATPRYVAGIGYALAAAGKSAEAHNIRDELAQSSRSGVNVPPYYFAGIYSMLGERDQAFEWLEKAYQVRDYQIGPIMIDPVFGSIRSDPRYTDLLRRMGLRQ